MMMMMTMMTMMMMMMMMKMMMMMMMMMMVMVMVMVMVMMMLCGCEVVDNPAYFTNGENLESRFGFRRFSTCFPSKGGSSDVFFFFWDSRSRTSRSFAGP